MKPLPALAIGDRVMRGNHETPPRPFSREEGEVVALLEDGNVRVRWLDTGIHEVCAARRLVRVAAAPAVKPYDVLGAIIDYEAGELTDAEAIELFQHLIDTGLAWQLQGSYGRQAQRLIEAGLCTRPKA